MPAFYRHDHQTVRWLHQGLESYLTFINPVHCLSSLEYAPPWDVYRVKVIVPDPDARDEGDGTREWGRRRINQMQHVKSLMKCCKTSECQHLPEHWMELF